MNVATVVLALVVATLFVLAIRYLRTNGMCSACEDKQACEAARACPSCACAPACPLQAALAANDHAQPPPLTTTLTAPEARAQVLALHARSPRPRT